MELNRHAALKGTLFVAVAALLWSTNGIFIKWLALSPFLIAGIRALIAGLVLLPFLRVKRIPWNLDLLVMVVSYCFHSLLIVLSFRTTSATIASGAQFAAPIWLFIVARLKKHPWRKSELIPLASLITGLVIFMLSSSEGTTLNGNIYALLSSFTFAALTYSSSRVSGDNPMGITSLSNLFTAAVLFTFFIPDKSLLSVVTPSQWLVFLYLGIFQLGLGYAFYYVGMRYISAQRAAMISPLELIASPLWIILFMKETPDASSLFGFVFILAGIVFNTMLQRNRKTCKPIGLREHL